LEDEETAAEEMEDKLVCGSIKYLESEQGGIVCVDGEEIGRESAREGVGEEYRGN
jgi:hypothetical protein